MDGDFEEQTLWVGERRMLRMREGGQELTVRGQDYRGLPRAVRVSQALRTGVCLFRVITRPVSCLGLDEEPIVEYVGHRFDRPASSETCLPQLPTRHDAARGCGSSAGLGRVGGVGLV